MKRPTLASRRARVARVNAKRPPAVAVDVERRTIDDPTRRRKLVTLLADLVEARRASLDSRKGSRRGSGR